MVNETKWKASNKASENTWVFETTIMPLGLRIWQISFLEKKDLRVGLSKFKAS